MGSAILLISSGAQIIGALGTLAPLAIDMALKIKKLMEASGEFNADITQFQVSAEGDAADTEKMIADWKAANGIE